MAFHSTGPFELQELNQAAERHKPELDAHPIPPVSRSVSRDQHPVLDCEWSLIPAKYTRARENGLPRGDTSRGEAPKILSTCITLKKAATAEMSDRKIRLNVKKKSNFNFCQKFPPDSTTCSLIPSSSNPHCMTPMYMYQLTFRIL